MKVYTVFTDAANDVTYSRESVNTCVGIPLFITGCYPLENNDII